MEKLVVQCRSCGKELEGHSGKTYSCGCSNMMTITGNSVSAVNMADIILVSQNNKSTKHTLSDQDRAWQEARSKRKIRKLDFEVR